MTLASLIANDAKPSEAELKEAISGHLCRCTGYQGMLKVARRLGAGERP
jgi:carbon-monoxide dehydrogenase small subunit